MNVRGTMGTLFFQSKKILIGDSLQSYKFGATAYKVDYICPFEYDIPEPAAADFMAFYRESEHDYSLEYMTLLLHCKETDMVSEKNKVEELGKIQLSDLRTLVVASDECFGKAKWCSKAIEPGAKYLIKDILCDPNSVPAQLLPYLESICKDDLDTITGADLQKYCIDNGIKDEFSLNRNSIHSTHFVEEALSIAESEWHAGLMFRAAVALSPCKTVTIYKVSNALILALNGADSEQVKKDFSGTNAFLELFS